MSFFDTMGSFFGMGGGGEQAKAAGAQPQGQGASSQPQAQAQAQAEPSLWDTIKTTTQSALQHMEDVAKDPAAMEAIKLQGAAGEADALHGESFETWDEVNARFMGRSRDDMQRVMDQYNAKYGPGKFEERFGSDVGRWDTAKVNPENVTKAVNEILNKEGTFSYDCAGIVEQLRGKSSAEIDAMRREFKEHAGVDMDEWIKNACTGALTDDDWASEAAELLKGDPVSGALQSLEHAADEGTGTDEDKIFKVLEGLTPQQRSEAISQYRRQHPDADLSGLIDGEMDFGDNDRAQALLRGDDATAIKLEMEAAAEGSWLMDLTPLGAVADAMGYDGTDEAGMYAAMDKVEQFQERDKKLGAEPSISKESLEAEFGGAGDLQAFLEGELGGAYLDKAEAKLEAASMKYEVNDAALKQAGYSDAFIEATHQAVEAEHTKVLAKAKAADLMIATDGAGTDEKAVWDALKGKDYKEVVAAFSAMGYGDVNAALADDLGFVDDEKFDVLKDRDKLGLQLATDGIGTDEEALKELLKGKTKAEIAALNESTGGLLDQIIEGELSGRDHHDVEMLKLYGGKGLSLKDKLAKEEADYGFERGEGKGYLGGITDLVSSKDDRLEAQHAELEKLEAGLSVGADGNLAASEEQMAQISKLIGRSEGDIKGLRADSDTVANTLAAVAAVAATAASGGTLGPALAKMLLGQLGVATAAGGAATAAMTVTTGAMTGLAGGVASSLTKAAVLGDAYGDEALGADFASTLAAMTTAGLMKVPVGGAAKLEGGAEGLLAEISSMGSSGGVAIDEAVAGSGFLGGLAAKGFSGGLGNVGNQLAMGATGSGLQGGTKLLGSVLGEGLIGGVTGYVEKGIFGQLFDENNYTGGKNGVGDVFLKALTSTAGGAVGGALGKGLGAGVPGYFDPRNGDLAGWLAANPKLAGGALGLLTGSASGMGKAMVDPKSWKNPGESLFGAGFTGALVGTIGGATSPYLKGKQDGRDVEEAKKFMGGAGTEIDGKKSLGGLDYKAAAKVYANFPGELDGLEGATLAGVAGLAKTQDNFAKEVAVGPAPFGSEASQPAAPIVYPWQGLGDGEDLDALIQGLSPESMNNQDWNQLASQ